MTAREGKLQVTLFPCAGCAVRASRFPVRRGLARLRQTLFFPSDGAGSDRQCMTANTREPAHGCDGGLAATPRGSNHASSSTTPRFRASETHSVFAARDLQPRDLAGELPSLGLCGLCLRPWRCLSRHPETLSGLRQPCQAPAPSTKGCPVR